MKFLVSILINSVAVVIASYFVPNVSISSYFTAILVAVFLGLINTFIKPIVKVLSLPINVLTLGLFSLVINGFFILLTSYYVAGFKVDGFLYAVLFSVVLSFVSGVLRIFIR